QFFNSASAVTSEIKPLPSKAPRDLLCLEYLVGKLNKTISPGFGPKAESIELVARLPPVWSGFPDVSSASEHPNIDGQRLLYGATTGKQPAAHDRNPLGIFSQFRDFPQIDT